MNRFFLMMFAVLCFTACDKLSSTLGDTSDYDFLKEVLGDKPEQMKVEEVTFSPDYKTLTMSANVIHDFGPYELSNPKSVRAEVVETIDGIRQAKHSTPRLIKIENVEAERIHEADIRMLVLVDLTLPQSDIDRIGSYIKEIQTSFNRGNLFVAFMDGPDVSNTMRVSDYVLEKHFNKSQNKYVCLYQSILQKKEEMLQGGEFWQDAKRLVLLTFSNEKIYDDETDTPFDSNHYQYEEQMVQIQSDTTVPFSAFYASMSPQKEINDEHNERVLWLFCHNNSGEFLSEFNWVACKNSMLKTFHLSFPDNVFWFENPDFKVYRGDRKKLTVNFHDVETDSIVASVSQEVILGNVFTPVIVNGLPMLYVILQGVFVGAILILFIYIVLQLIVPFIKHRHFLRKYVVNYTGKNMCFDNNPVQEHCYLCKSPFKEGDEIVVKCSHTMHKSCWDENEYHCPEYSDRCKTGSHYYNSSNVFDDHNAPFYLKWILVSIASAVIAWMLFSLYAHGVYGIYDADIIRFFAKNPHGSVTQMPVFGLMTGFILTAGFSLLAIRPGKDGLAIGKILLRSVLAGLGSFLCFLLMNVIIILFDIQNYASLMNWIPWVASGFIITFCSTFVKRMMTHKKWLILAAVLLGILSMYSWMFFFTHTQLDYRVLLLLSFIIFSIGLCACVATIAPRSEHYYLKIQGATKGMDIALYKWFRNDPERVVTLGKSVDCSLQLSWDIQGDVAPVQAEIRLKKNVPYLVALEPGVFINEKPLVANKKVKLFHGKSFTIGQTMFTFVEKDR